MARVGITHIAGYRQHTQDRQSRLRVEITDLGEFNEAAKTYHKAGKRINKDHVGVFKQKITIREIWNGDAEGAKWVEGYMFTDEMEDLADRERIQEIIQNAGNEIFSSFIAWLNRPNPALKAAFDAFKVNKST